MARVVLAEGEGENGDDGGEFQAESVDAAGFKIDQKEIVKAKKLLALAN